ncbi:nuclear mitotic apparatus protein 1 isoform X1 [Periophthalmus magnuspinnatus]|uniref:nuclear mitotic apparatus protein 1 isoform X1 n=1 Tax=Periophthalmus magnuspinnatus TaxID=409849 RepID=UPI0024371039|nr:nuclear mitotic apparatus protein 1 isoform X1 [Periophthalmus magnuspinnatus]
MNLGVKALLSWVKATIATESEAETDVNIEDLQNGEILLKLVHLLKRESSTPCLSNCVDDRFKIISDFVERDCRFNALNGTPIIWETIKDGSNLTIEIAKVLLLLVYHDMMNDHCTLRTLDCDVENQIASLTATYVMESEGSVSLRPGLDAHLSRRYLPVPRDVFDKSSSTSLSSASSVYDDESPLFVRSQKVKFLDLQNVASSSVSSSPIQDIMNTPIFQMRKMQRQLLQDRDYRDGLEKELSSKLALLAQRETQINQLQYCLDKLKEDQRVGEQFAKEQNDELENKNNMLQSRFNDVLKQNKELKGNAALMERKIDELTEENGVLSCQMRTVCSQLANFEAEVGRLTVIQTSNEVEWRSTVSNLQSELNEARAQKELLAEQTEILQGKISCLEDKISRSTQEEEGDNMWVSVEKELLENKISLLTNELENTANSLQKIEVEVQAKSQQLKEREQEISDQKKLLLQQQNQIGQLIESKKMAVENLVKEMTEMRERLQQEICALKLRLEEAEQKKHEQMTRLQVQVELCNQEIEMLKKEDLQTSERIKDLMTKLCTANNLLADKDQEVNSLTEKVVLLTEINQQTKDESLAKEEKFSQLLLEKSRDEEVLQSSIQSLKDQVNNLKTSLTHTEEELQIEKNRLSQTNKDSSERIEGLNHDLVLCKETIETLKEELHIKDEQIIKTKKDNAIVCERLQEEICALKSQINGLGETLSEAKQQVQTQQSELLKREEESSHQKVLLQQQLTSSEEMVKNLKVEIGTKIEQISLLENQTVEQSVLLKREADNFQQQVESLTSRLIKAEGDLCFKENDLVLKQQQVESLQTKVSEFEKEIKTLHANIQTKEEELFNLKGELSTDMKRVKEENLKRSEELENEIQFLSSQVQSLKRSLNSATEQLTLTEGMLAKKEMEMSHEEEVIQKLKTTFDEEMLALRQHLCANEEQMITLKSEADSQSSIHQQEIQSLKDQLYNMAEALSKAEEMVQTQLQIITEQEIKSAQEKESLEKKLLDSQAVIRELENEITVKEQQMTELRTQSSEQSNVLYEQNEYLQKRMESLASSLKATEDEMHSKESILTQQQHENQLKQKELCGLQLKVEQAEKEMAAFKQEKSVIQVNLQEKEDLLIKTKEQYQMVQAELSAIKFRMSENDKDVGKLRDDAVAQRELLHKAQEQVKNKDDMLKELKGQSSRQTDDLQRCVEILKGQLEDCSQKLVGKELESAQQIDHLKQELVSLNSELNQHKELNTHVLRQKEETLESTQKERDYLIKEKEALHERILAVEKQLEVTASENQRLARAKQAIERENDAALKLQTKLQQELQMLKQDNDALLNGKMEDVEAVKTDFLEQLSAKSTAVEHYKAQMEKAVSHYNSKKQLLQKSEEEMANLKHSLEVQEREVKTVTMENKLLQMELDKIQSNEKFLLNKITSLEAQLSFADKALRAQSKFQYDEKTSEQMPSTLEVPGERYGMNTRAKLRSMSSDSLDQSSLDDSLNNTRKLSAPSEASTPLVRSSERLAAKRRGPQAESLETLYFTPINTRHRTTTDFKPEESAKRNSASSVKRRRTTQVINITMTKKTPGHNEADETFYSLTSARSQPNLSSAHKAQGISTELFTTPKASEADQLIGLPGYRRSTIHSQATSTFCVGTENEPEGGPEDWMRIAEIQARNKACLPHLKSSYPVEFDTVRNSALMFTDEELRTGDPIETIRRASVMPGQLQDSLTSHRLSYMGQSGNNATSWSRLSLMPGQAIPEAVSSTLRNPKTNKRAPSTLTIHSTSPEKKIRASCFPRPLTPKNKNVSGPAIPHIQTADRRQSMMFTIDNTPRKDPRKDILKKGLSKLRSSTRKSPGKNLKSPAQSANRHGQENIPVRNGRIAVGGAARLGSQKSPLMANKGPKKSPRVSTRAAKSPGLTASARKECVPVTQENLTMMSRMKV